MEEGLRSQSLALVIGVLGEAELTPARRLSLAAAEHLTPCLLVTDPRLSPAGSTATRWRVGARGSASHPFDGAAPGRGPVRRRPGTLPTPPADGRARASSSWNGRMKRIVSVWLPLWPIERMRRAQPSLVPDDVPLALIETGTHGIRITAVNPQAAVKACASVRPSPMRAPPCLRLATQPADPRRDRTALLRLARWCGRYGPNRNIDGDDGLWIDITGVAHLYGGEAQLIAISSPGCRASG